MYINKYVVKKCFMKTTWNLYNSALIISGYSARFIKISCFVRTYLHFLNQKIKSDREVNKYVSIKVRVFR